jgi:adenosylmethionine-8-amino-7-oxononanoate aminotransferase
MVRQGVPTPALWSAQAHMPSVLGRQIEIVGGEGAYVTTSSGQRLLDATAGLWHTNVGHGREELARAAYDQMKRLETYHVFGRFVNDAALALADRVAAYAPFLDARVILTSGGSDSVDSACKLARRHWQLEGKKDKKVILSREYAYHGLHGFGTSVAGLQPNRDGYGTDSLIPETARVAHSDIAQVEMAIRQIGASNIAAIIAEPIMGDWWRDPASARVFGGTAAPRNRARHPPHRRRGHHWLWSRRHHLRLRTLQLRARYVVDG